MSLYDIRPTPRDHRADDKATEERPKLSPEERRAHNLALLVKLANEDPTGDHIVVEDLGGELDLRRRHQTGGVRRVLHDPMQAGVDDAPGFDD